MRHWGARMVTDRHRGYGGYFLTKGGRTVLFAGDTAFTDLLTPLGGRADIHLAILLHWPSTTPASRTTVSPEQAWCMFKDVGEVPLPVHHSTFG